MQDTSEGGGRSFGVAGERPSAIAGSDTRFPGQKQTRCAPSALRFDTCRGGKNVTNQLTSGVYIPAPERGSVSPEKRNRPALRTSSEMGGGKEMSLTYLVLTAEVEPLELQKQLNDKGAEGYRLAGVIPPIHGFQPKALIILEKEASAPPAQPRTKTDAEQQEELLEHYLKGTRGGTPKL